MDISYNELKDEGAKYLSDALKSDNCILTELDISHNELTDKGAKYLSDSLKSDNCKLTELYIIHNKLTDKGAKYLTDVLKSENCKLTGLTYTLKVIDMNRPTPNLQLGLGNEIRRRKLYLQFAMSCNCKKIKTEHCKR